MAKFTGFMCDVCKATATGEQRPVDWIVVRLPGNGEDGHRDLCSDKCLLKFARERAAASAPPKESKPGLSEYLEQNGIPASKRGALSAQHARLRHEVAGAVDDCLVCQFLEAG